MGELGDPNNVVATIKFDWDNHVLIVDTKNCMDHAFFAHIRELVGNGSGNTKEEAVASLIASLRRTADTIELAAKNTIPLRRTNGNGNTQG